MNWNKSVSPPCSAWWRMLSTFWEIQFPFKCWLVVVHVVIKMDKIDHRALGYVPRHRLNQSHFQGIQCLCILSCLWWKDFKWLGDDWNDQCSSKSHLEWCFPPPLPFKSHSDQRHLQSRVVILNTETFIIIPGIVSPSLSCGSAVRTCEDVPKNRMLLWATWSWRLRLRLGGPSPFVHESRSPWGTGHDALVNQNSKTKAYPYHPSFLWSIFTNSIFPDSAVGRGQGSPRKVTVWISKSSKHRDANFCIFLPKIGSSYIAIRYNHNLPFFKKLWWVLEVCDLRFDQRGGMD